jgi:hypothetical protein
LIIISSVPPVVIQGAGRIELGWREDCQSPRRDFMMHQRYLNVSTWLEKAKAAGLGQGHR